MVEISGKHIGEGDPVFVTFEAGPTHSGLASAKRLVDQAATAGADAIKFQILNAERLVRDPDMMVSYGYLKDRSSEEIIKYEEKLRDVLNRRSLKREEWLKLKEYSDQRGILFFATVSYEEEIDLVLEMGCPSIKIASLDVNHVPLLRAAARTGLCIQFDTGSATIGEIEAAVDVLLEEGNENFIIHHCPSGYPARLESINLRIIPTLKQMFGCPVAFSDHTPGNDMDIAAVAIGADMIEKTITEDRSTKSPEHVMSIEGAQLGSFIKSIRDLEIALGDTRRRMTNDEKSRRALRRRSAFAGADLSAGTTLKEAFLDFSRPGQGLSPDEVERYQGAKLKRDLVEGELLTLQDLEF